MTAPVQVLVVGVDEPTYTGRVLAELDRLREQGVVRLIDVLLVRRQPDGSFDTLPSPPGADPGLGDVVADLLRGDDPDTPGPTWSLTDAIAPGEVAAVALLEHLWAAPLVDVIDGAGGRALAEAWLAPEDRARLAGR